MLDLAHVKYVEERAGEVEEWYLCTKEVVIRLSSLPVVYFEANKMSLSELQKAFC